MPDPGYCSGLEAKTHLQLTTVNGVLTPFTIDPDPDPVTWRGVGVWLLRRLSDEVSLDNSDGTTRLHLRFRYRDRQDDALRLVLT